MRTAGCFWVLVVSLGCSSVDPPRAESDVGGTADAKAAVDSSGAIDSGASSDAVDATPPADGAPDANTMDVIGDVASTDVIGIDIRTDIGAEHDAPDILDVPAVPDVPVVPGDIALPDAGGLVLQAGQLGTLGVRGWNLGATTIVDDGFEYVGTLCSGTTCVTGGLGR